MLQQACNKAEAPGRKVIFSDSTKGTVNPVSFVFSSCRIKTQGDIYETLYCIDPCCVNNDPEGRRFYVNKGK